MKKNEKIIINKSNLIKDFTDWINGIQEDEPLKIEATHIYFIVEFSQNDIVLSYSADEKLLKHFDYGAYFPLDAEYFDSNDLKSLSKELFDEKKISKQDVKNWLFDVTSQGSKCISFFAEHRVFFGERFSEVLPQTEIK